MSRRRRGADLDERLEQLAARYPRHSQALKDAQRMEARRYLVEQLPSAALLPLQEAALGLRGDQPPARMKYVTDPRGQVPPSITAALRLLSPLIKRVHDRWGPLVPSPEQWAFVGELLSPGGELVEMERASRTFFRTSTPVATARRFAAGMLDRGVTLEPAAVPGPADLRAFALVAGLGDAPTGTWKKTRQRALKDLLRRLQAERADMAQRRRSCELLKNEWTSDDEDAVAFEVELARSHRDRSLAEERSHEVLSDEQQVLSKIDADSALLSGMSLDEAIDLVRTRHRRERTAAAAPEKWAPIFKSYDQRIAAVRAALRESGTNLVRLPTAAVPNNR